MPRYDVRPHRGTRRLTFMMGPTATRCQITRPRWNANSITGQFHHPLKAAQTEDVLMPKLLQWSPGEPVYL